MTHPAKSALPSPGRPAAPAAAGAVRTVEGGVILLIHAQPRAKRTEWVGTHGAAIKVRIASPPVDGAANAELCRFVAEALGLPKSAVTVRRGETGREKQLWLRGVSVALVAAALEKAGK